MPALFFALIFMAFAAQHADATTFSSGPARTQHIELYTSEGCSSCPPAEQWLNQLKSSSQLFQTLFPMALHVDYWDNLGWKDPFSQQQFSERQRLIARRAHAKQVYTPSFIVDGIEWRGFFTTNKTIPISTKDTGVLKVNVKHLDTALNISGQFLPEPALLEDTFHLHLAILGFGIQHTIQAGENHGKTLEQDFVVLHHETWDERWLKPEQGQKNISWHGMIHELPNLGQKEIAITVWIEKANDPTPIQTTGGWL